MSTGTCPAGSCNCGCCTGTTVETPEALSNRPGLSAIAYRIGTHPELKASLLARISESGLDALRDLRTRDDDDFTIALLDAFASLADVFTFYQERIANESYLRTATERRSLLELARLVGYELKPGVAATADLAFSIEDAPGGFGRAITLTTTTPTAPETPPPIAIPLGAKVQTIPGPGETVEMFETVEAIEARAEWNAIPPRMLQPQSLTVDMTVLYLTGTTYNLTKGDRLLLSAGNAMNVRAAREVTLDADHDRTRIDLEPPAASHTVAPSQAFTDSSSSSVASSVARLSRNASLADTARDIAGGHFSGDDIALITAVSRFEEGELVLALRRLAVPQPVVTEGVYVFRQHAAVFAYNAPNWGAFHDKPQPATWENDTLETLNVNPVGDTRYIYLDHEYPEVQVGSYIVLEAPDTTQRILQVTDVAPVVLTQYTVGGKSTRLTVESGSLSDFKFRTTSLLVQSEPLSIAQLPIDDDIAQDSIELDAYYPGLKAGRRVSVTGSKNDASRAIVSEIRTVASVTLNGPFTVLHLSKALENAYLRESVTVNANLALSTHGETVTEPLGSGDATKVFQRFTLKQPPLTYVPADNENGAVSTLELRVNSILWSEVPFFYGHGPDERIYILRQRDDGGTDVIFGDGRTGARLPTGDNNITARYRRGIGLEGLVRTNQISQMMLKPLGVNGATNPLPSSGAGAPETIAAVRRNAGLTALTLGRVVSLQDYEDFSRAFPGIGKAKSAWSWSGQQRQILLTIAAENGDPLDPESELGLRLTRTLANLGHPHVSVTLVPCVLRYFRVRARIKVDPAFLTDNVFAAARARVLTAFSFDAREFGQSVNLSEVVAVMQAVEGVIAVSVIELYPSDEAPTPVRPRISADAAASGAQVIVILDPREIPLEVLV